MIIYISAYKFIFRICILKLKLCFF